MEEKFHLLKVRTFSDVINDSVVFLKKYLRQIGYVILVLVVPLYIIGSFLQSASVSSPFDFTRGSNFVNWGKIGGGSVIGGLLLIFGNALLSLIFISTFLKVEQSETGEIESSDIFDGVKENLGRLLGYYFLVFVALIVILGLLFLVMAALGSISAYAVIVLLGLGLMVGAVYLWVSLAFVTIIYMREMCGIGEAVSRSFYLIKENFWWTFLILFVALIVAIISGYIFKIPYLIILMVRTIISASSGREGFDVSILDRVALTVGNLGNILTAVVFTIVSFMQYYSLVEKKDGLDLQQQIDNIGIEENSPN
ncbi:MAG: hypothetical protein JWO03_1312 [Bacteroidetes bacterium]|nr:hypothetical protein [Bacteroidota bacterium]